MEFFQGKVYANDILHVIQSREVHNKVAVQYSKVQYMHVTTCYHAPGNVLMPNLLAKLANASLLDLLITVIKIK